MKKILAIAILAILFVSCKKNSDDNVTAGTNTVQATIGGTSYTFNVGVSATKSGANTILTIGGIDGTSAAANSIALYMSSSSVLAAGMFTETGATTNASAVFQQGLSSGIAYSEDNSPTNPLKIVITSITSTSVQGTFSGDIYLNGNNASTKKVISSGSFNVNF